MPIKTVLDITDLSQADLARVFTIKPASVAEWLEKDPPCPRKDNGRYDLKAVLVWYKDFLTSKYKAQGSIKDEKTEWEIERLKAQVNKINDTYIERTQHELILTSRASSLRTFLEKSFLNNVHHFANKTADELRTQMYTFVSSMMRAYTGSSEDKQPNKKKGKKTNVRTRKAKQ